MNMAYIQPKDHYGNKLILSILLLFAIMLAMMYKIQQTEPATPHHSFVVTAPTSKTIYLLSSKTSALLYARNGASAEKYAEKLQTFAKFLTDTGYHVEIIPEKRISSLHTDDILFAVDATALNTKTKKEIKAFVNHGGNLFFNFTAGFSDNKGNYIGDRFVHDITGLHLDKKLGFISMTGSAGSFITQKILSPFSGNFKNGKLLSVALYDKLPIITTPKNMKPDIFLTSFAQATPPTAKNPSQNIDIDDAGIAWHGYTGKGKWVYTSLPGYSFYDIEEDKDDYKKIISGMVDFLSQKIITQKYPFVDQKSAVFISEDTEYKFTNFERFADLAKEYKIPVTAFIVANLANLPEHKAMMHKIKKNSYVEFASHSMTHKKIVGESEDFIINETENSKKVIDQFAPVPIKGFRPPREELNALMKKHLAEGGYTYVLGALEPYLYPEFDKKEPSLLYIPRHGTDDYSYLVNLDWSQKEIHQQIVKEANFVTDLNGIYTLSVHTHLFSYSSNINIIRSFYNYLQKHPELKPLNGREIFQRVTQANHIHQTAEIIGNQLVLTIDNHNHDVVKNLHIKIFKNPHNKIISGRVDNDAITVHVSNFDNTLTIDKLPPDESIKVYLTLKDAS